MGIVQTSVALVVRISREKVTQARTSALLVVKHLVLIHFSRISTKNLQGSSRLRLRLLLFVGIQLTLLNLKLLPCWRISNCILVIFFGSRNSNSRWSGLGRNVHLLPCPFHVLPVLVRVARAWGAGKQRSGQARQVALVELPGAEMVPMLHLLLHARAATHFWFSENARRATESLCRRVKPGSRAGLVRSRSEQELAWSQRANFTRRYSKELGESQGGAHTRSRRLQHRLLLRRGESECREVLQACGIVQRACEVTLVR
mmetsp:Transcript_9915/g.18711  ORF Transcript_9915/g.18711 Transcript_9915/m.18711 type:complete len:259 (-) Transcript_9915:473-1249(-)